MKFKRNRILYMLLIFLVACTGNKKPQGESKLELIEKKGSDSIIDLKSVNHLIGKDIGFVLKFFNKPEFDYLNITIDTIEYDEFEWNSISLIGKDGEDYLIFETSFGSKKIHKYTILSPKVYFKYGNVGSSFSEIKQYVDSTKLNYFNDGELGLVSLKDKHVAYFMDTSNISNSIFYGINSLDQIPADTKVVEIVVFDTKID